MSKVAYYTGLRRGEILGMKRDSVKLSPRLIMSASEDCKEADWKRVPVRLELIPILEECLKVTSLKSDHVFLVNDGKGLRPVSRRLQESVAATNHEARVRANTALP
ncbi:MAG: tyrosine-type recombinase/integrase [Pseudomonadota bacterium]